MEESLNESFEGCAVIFRNVKEYYSTNQTITCTFSLKQDCVVEDPDNCYVGLFHVGWDNLESCIVKRCFSQMWRNATSGLHTHEFSPSEIPDHNIDEFYQFCFYNNITEVVLGASCPFQICDLAQVESFINVRSSNTTVEDIGWWIPNPMSEDLEDSVLIHNKTTMLEGILNKQAEKNEELQQSNACYKADFNKVLMEQKEFEQKTEEEINDLNDKISFLEKRDKLQQQNLAESDAVIEHLTQKIEEIKDSLNQEYGNKLSQLKNRLETTTQEYDAISNEKEILILKLNDIVQSSELKEQKLSAEQRKSAKLGKELEAMQELMLQERNSYRQLENSYKDMVKSFQTEIQSLGKDQNVSTGLQEQLKQVEDNLTLEKEKNRALIDEADKMSYHIEQLQNEKKEKDSMYQAEMEKHIIKLNEKTDLVEVLIKEKDNLVNKFVDVNDTHAKKAEEHEVVVVDLKDKLTTIKRQFENDKEIHAREISDLQHGINSKMEQISDMEVALKECRQKIVEAENKEAAVLSSEQIIDELKAKNQVLENQINLKSSPHVSLFDSKGSSLDAGSRHALQVAYTHARKQLKRIQKEKDHYQKLYTQVEQSNSATDDITELKRSNEEMKLRLCMGKTAYQEKYLECQKLNAKLLQMKSGNSNVKMDQSCGMDAVKADDADLHEVDSKRTLEQKVKVLEVANEKLSKTHSDTQKELRQLKENEQIFMMEMETLKKKSKKLADHYEEKLRLVEEENRAVKKHKDALLRGEMKAAPMEQHIVEKQPTSDNGIVIYHPPSAREKVVDEQPVCDRILYPPSLKPTVNKMETFTENLNARLYPPKLEGNLKHPLEPVTQVMPSRETNNSQHSPRLLFARGKREVPLKENLACPVCWLQFPSNVSNSHVTEHVNSHFKD